MKRVRLSFFFLDDTSDASPSAALFRAHQRTLRSGWTRKDIKDAERGLLKKKKTINIKRRKRQTCFCFWPRSLSSPPPPHLLPSSSSPGWYHLLVAGKDQHGYELSDAEHSESQSFTKSPPLSSLLHSFCVFYFMDQICFPLFYFTSSPYSCSFYPLLELL